MRMARHLWHLQSRAIDEWVEADDQHEAWANLRDRSAVDFGLIVTAEPDEAGAGETIAVHTSALMFAWGRNEDAQKLIDIAIEAGLPDTTEADKRYATEYPA